MGFLITGKNLLLGDRNMPVFDYGQQEIEHLGRQDKKLGEAIKRIGRLEREVIPDLFTALMNSIVSQQISSKAALTVWTRLQNKLGTVNVRTISEASPDVIQQCGLSIRKASYMKGVAEAVLQNELDLSALSRLPDQEIIVQLVGVEGKSGSGLLKCC
jgi:3-methyladenine DNA glycosylase/8-oxoguanine DNA glycosylase